MEGVCYCPSPTYCFGAHGGHVSADQKIVDFWPAGQHHRAVGAEQHPSGKGRKFKYKYDDHDQLYELGLGLQNASGGGSVRLYACGPALWGGAAT